MKKILLVGLVYFLLMSSLQAASSRNISVNAVVPQSSPEISLTILRIRDGDPDGNPWTNSEVVTSMDFGTLKHTLTEGSSSGLWFSDTFFCVVIYTTPYGKPYDVRSSCTGLVSGANSLPTGSFGLAPAYSADDQWCWGSPPTCVKQGAMPSGASLGTAGPAIGTTPRLIYSSETGTATARIIRAYYSLPTYKADGTAPFPGFTPIPLTQPAGTYTGTVTITITTK